MAQQLEIDSIEVRCPTCGNKFFYDYCEYRQHCPVCAEMIYRKWLPLICKRCGSKNIYFDGDELKCLNCARPYIQPDLTLVRLITPRIKAGTHYIK